MRSPGFAKPAIVHEWRYGERGYGACRSDDRRVIVGDLGLSSLRPRRLLARAAADARRRTAGAAGGCVLVRRSALERIGGVASVRGMLIDDCALARRIKTGGSIWLGLAAETRSLRRYPRLGDIWRMIARTAYTQLGHSPLVLAGTVLGLVLTYLVPPILTVFGSGIAAYLAAAAWLAMTIAFVPILRV